MTTKNHCMQRLCSHRQRFRPIETATYNNVHNDIEGILTELEDLNVVNLRELKRDPQRFQRHSHRHTSSLPQLLPIQMQKKTACHSGRRQSISSVDSSWSSCPSSVTSTAGPPSHHTTPVTARVHMQHAPSAGPPQSHPITSRSRSRKNFTVHS